MKLPNKLYDFFKDCVMVYLPALAVFYLGLSEVWNLPYGEEVKTTILLLVAFLGTCLKINNYYYKKPYQMHIDTYIDDEEVKAEEVKE